MTPVARRALASVALQQMAGAALPELPTAAGLQWRVLTAPTELQQHCPYTAPISAYRGRHLAHRLELALQHDYGHPAGSKRAVDSAIQLRYKLSQAPRTAHGPGAELLLPPLVAQYTAGVAQQHPQHHLELQGNGVQGDGSGVQPQGGAVRHLALDKHLFIEDFDTFAADVAARHVDLHLRDKALVTAYLDSVVWLQHTHPYAPCSTCSSHGGANPSAAGADLAQGPSSSTTTTGASSAGVGGGAAWCATRCRHFDLWLTGQVTWVGSSSLEVTLELSREALPGEASGHLHAPAPATPPPPPQQQQQQRQQEGSGGQGQAEDQVGRSAGEGGGAAAPPPPARVLVAEARFVMATRELSLRKAVQAPRLAPGNEAERRLFEQGAARQHARHAGRKQEHTQPLDSSALQDLHRLVLATANHPPLWHPHAKHPRRRDHLHDGDDDDDLARHPHSSSHRSEDADDVAALQHADQGLGAGGAAGTGVAPQTGQGGGVRTVRSTLLRQTFVTQFQERNTTGTVFGGQLLLYGLHVGEAVAAAFAAEEAVGDGSPLPPTCQLLAMRDVPFMALVPLGHVMHVSGKAVATASAASLGLPGYLVVVHTKAQRPETALGRPSSSSAPGPPSSPPPSRGVHGGAMVQTHAYWLIFHVPGASPSRVPTLVPQSMHELREWTHAQRVLSGLPQLLHLKGA